MLAAKYYKRRRALTAAYVLVCLYAVLGPARLAAQEDGRGLVTGLQIKAEDGRWLKLYDESYALLIGVSKYSDGWPSLPGVGRDIKALRPALEQQGFKVEVVENPTSVQLDQAFRNFIRQHGQRPDNRLLIYFAGHGHTMQQSYGAKMGYIVPTDAPDPQRDAAGFRDKAIDMQQIENYARRMQAKHALFLFDSCFSGSFFALTRAVPYSIGYKTSLPVRQFITSGEEEELVPDQSIFRRQLLSALTGEADLNHDDYVTGTELGAFLQDTVSNYSRGAQHPQYGKLRSPDLDKGDFVFTVPKPAAAPVATAAATPTPTLPTADTGKPIKPPATPQPTPAATSPTAATSNAVAPGTKPANDSQGLSALPAGLRPIVTAIQTGRGQISELRGKRRVYISPGRPDGTESIIKELKKYDGLELVSDYELADIIITYQESLAPVSPSRGYIESVGYMHVYFVEAITPTGLSLRPVWDEKAHLTAITGNPIKPHPAIDMARHFVRLLKKTRGEK